MTSVERIKVLLAGKLPDRPPFYDVIRNDAVLEHFGAAELTPETVQQTVVRAHVAALDATKSFYRLPEFNPGRIAIEPNGCKTTFQRWTSWTEHAVFESTDAYAQAKAQCTADPWDWNDGDQATLDQATREWRELTDTSGDIVRNYLFPGPPRLDQLFPEVGLEFFSYCMADCPDILHRQIEHRFEKLVQAVEHSDLPDDVLIIDETCDMAFKTGLLFPPDFLRQSFIPGYTRLCEALHNKGRKVLFHSDGNLWDILDDLVKAGIDLFHPVEPLAGMDPGEVHKRYPNLILCGTIDVSQLLPYGTEQEVIDQVVRNIEATEGKIMVGSSTEINNEVPLKNYLALHETVLGYTY